MTVIKSKFLIIFILFYLLGCYGYLDVSIHASKTSIPLGTPFTIDVNFKNTLTDSSIFMLKWGTPFDSDGLFQVLYNTSNVPFEGISAYRMSPRISDYIEIKAGEVKIVLSELWKNFDFSKVGTYYIRLDYYIQGYFLNAEGEKIEFATLSGLSNELMIEIISDPNIKSSLTREFKVLANFPCSGTQTNYINSAWGKAKPAMTNAANNFNSGSSKYAQWFGAVTSSRAQHVKIVLDKLKALSNLKYQCGGDQCTASTYGYVFPTDTAHNVYLCTLFWKDTVEAVRTIIHESSHFNNVGNTKDYAYGQSNCMSLAKTAPDKAVDNADNYCYFCY